MSERETNQELENKSTKIHENDAQKIKIDFEEIHEKKLENDSENCVKKEGKHSKVLESNKKRLIIIGTILVISTIFIIVLSTIFALLNINNQNIMSGVSIKGIDVSGLSRDDAKSQIETVFNEKKGKDISIKYEEFESQINPTAIEANYNIEKAIDDAYKIGRKSNILVNNYEILKALILKYDINVECTINEEITKNTITDISKKLPGAVIESDYYIEDNNLIIKKGKSGISVNVDNFLNDIKNNLNNISANNDYLMIPVFNMEPKEINIKKIHEEVYKEVVDAYYTTNPFTVHQEIEGIDFNIEDAKKILNEDKEEYNIPLKITKPKVTLDDIGTEAFPDLLATFSTKYDASNKNRSTNLRLAANKINGTVIMPGKEFSYNKIVGERTIAAGYKEAKIYSNGQVVDGLGGGICQISSTLYNAVVFANLDITSRRNHQFVTSYVPAGRDATVVYGSQDFKFKNTRKYPVKIKASVKSGVATVSIYGIKEEVEYDVSFKVNTISTIPFSVSYVDDSSLATGKEVVKQKGSNGIITETYKIVKQNGKVVSRKLLSRDTYNAMKKIIARGTKGTIIQTTAPLEDKQNNVVQQEQIEFEKTENMQTNIIEKPQISLENEVLNVPEISENENVVLNSNVTNLNNTIENSVVE